MNETSFGELLKIVEKSIQAGGSGVCIGRQVFGSENPELCIKALKAIVHEGISAKDATKFLE